MTIEILNPNLAREAERQEIQRAINAVDQVLREGGFTIRVGLMALQQIIDHNKHYLSGGNPR